MTISEFLEARIAEDEKLALDVAATVAPDEWENPTKWGNFFPADIVFYDSQTPHRVLAECAAKRAIIEYADQVETMDYQIMNEWGGGLEGTGDNILKALAAVYADHPDYDESWRL